MKLGRILPFLFLIVLIPAYFSILFAVSSMNKRLPMAEEVNVVLPSPVLKITSLEYDGLVSDALYLKSLVFYGSTWVGKNQRKVKEWEYDWLYNTLKASTDLDPYFLDPYFFANGILTWEANRVRDVNTLLEKGCRYRSWDYWLPFYLGFNYYYFLGDNDKAAEYLMAASKKPGADPFYGYFAARLSYKSNRTENAIIFLEGMPKTTKDETIRKDYETRLEALKAILYLEKSEAVYKEKFGKNPDNINKLIDKRIISQIPQDPYGGEFYIDKDGSVKTTSDLRPMKKTKNN